MRHVRNRILIALVGMGIAGAAFADGHDENALWHAWATAFGDYWVASFNGGDADATTAIYADDMVGRAFDGSILAGRDAWRQLNEAQIGMGLTFRPISRAPRASGLLGDDGAWALVEYEVLGPDGNVAARGESIWLFERVDGAYEMVAVASFDTTPPPETP